MGRGDWHDPRLGDVPFGEWADRWLTTKTPKLQPSTVDLYRYLLRKHVVPRFGKAAVGRITAVEVQAWLAELHATDLSPNTIAKAYRVLSGVMDGAVDARLIARSPCTIKGAGTERHDEMQIATPEQVAAIAAAVGPRWEALVFTGAYGGLRWGELAALRRCDIDLASKTIAVTRKLAEVNGQLSYGRPKSAAGRRTIGVPSFVARSLAVHIDLYALPGDNGLVFPSPDGEPLRRSNFRRRVWEPATGEVGMSGFRFHDLRHTAAVMMLNNGVPINVVSQVLGHKDPAMTLRRYAHVLSDAQQIAADKIDAYGF